MSKYSIDDFVTGTEIYEDGQDDRINRAKIARKIRGNSFLKDEEFDEMFECMRLLADAHDSDSLHQAVNVVLALAEIGTIYVNIPDDSEV